MKRKGLVASILAVFMSITMIVPVFAMGGVIIDENKNISSWGDQYKNEPLIFEGNHTLTVDEGAEVSVGGVYANFEGMYDVTITGGGTLNVNSESYSGITGNNITINNTTVNTTGPVAGISAMGDVTITDSKVSAIGTGQEWSEGINAEGTVKISNSEVLAKGNTWALAGRDITIGDGSSVISPDGALVKPMEQGNEFKIIYESDGTTWAKEVKIGKSEAPSSASAILNPVPQSDNNSSGSDGGTVCASIAQMITNAAQGATVRVTITKGSSLCKMAVDALEARPDVTLVVDYAVNDGMYEATIPAGTALAQYKNAAGGIDFETLTVHFGGKQIF